MFTREILLSAPASIVVLLLLDNMVVYTQLYPHMPAFAIAHACILGLHWCRFHALKPHMHCALYSARY